LKEQVLKYLELCKCKALPVWQWCVKYLEENNPQFTDCVRCKGKSLVLPILFMSGALFFLWLYLWPSSFEEKQGFADLTVKVLGGTAAALAAYFTWKRLDVAQRTLEVSQEGQITERYTRSVEQLGALHNDGRRDLEVRIGAIHSLGQIAQNSLEYRGPILDILLNYLRYNTSGEIESAEDRADLGAVFTVIRNWIYTDNEYKQFDFNNVAVKDADLSGSRFINFRFHNSSFIMSYFLGSLFQDTSVLFSSLDRSYFKLSRFFNVTFTGGSLVGSVFTSCEFRGGGFYMVDLSRASFENSRGLTHEMFEQALIDRTTKLPAEFLEDVEWYEMQIARSEQLREIMVKNEKV